MSASEPSLIVSNNDGEMPYRGLAAFGEKDAAYFYGRQQETQKVAALLLSSRFTLLYGPSGVGKSSLLQAGVVHEIKTRARKNLIERGAPQFLVIYFKRWSDDPIADLLQTVEQAIRQVLIDVAPPPRTELVPTLHAWSERTGSTLLVILDQFEEYFLYHGTARAQDPFGVQLVRAVNDSELRANFMVGLRADTHDQLDIFKNLIPRLYENSARVEHLKRPAGRQAITEPLARFNQDHPTLQPPATIEAELVEAVLNGVRVEHARRSRAKRAK